jgi:hypothetical protein
MRKDNMKPKSAACDNQRAVSPVLAIVPWTAAM